MFLNPLRKMLSAMHWLSRFYEAAFTLSFFYNYDWLAYHCIGLRINRRDLIPEGNIIVSVNIRTMFCFSTKILYTIALKLPFE